MARVLYGDGIVEIDGTIGGTTFRHTWCGNLASAGHYESREASDKQKAVRSAFSRLMHHYLPMWATYEFVARWQDWANNHPITNKKGEVIELAWHAQFAKHNIPRLLDGKEPDRFPPD